MPKILNREFAYAGEIIQTLKLLVLVKLLVWFTSFGLKNIFQDIWCRDLVALLKKLFLSEMIEVIAW